MYEKLYGYANYYDALAKKGEKEKKLPHLRHFDL